MISDDLARRAQDELLIGGSQSAVNEAFAAVRSWAEAHGIDDYALEFLKALRTWKPEKGGFWGRITFRLRKDVHSAARAGYRKGWLGADITAVDPPQGEPEPTPEPKDVRPIWKAMHAAGHEVWRLWLWLTARPNSSEMSSMSVGERLLWAKERTTVYDKIPPSEVRRAETNLLDVLGQFAGRGATGKSSLSDVVVWSCDNRFEKDGELYFPETPSSDLAYVA